MQWPFVSRKRYEREVGRFRHRNSIRSRILSRVLAENRKLKAVERDVWGRRISSAS